MINIKWIQTEKQNQAWEILNDKTTTELLFGGGAGGGKSFLGCSWIILKCGEYPGTRWMIGRSKLKTLKETTLKTFFEVCSKWGIKSGDHYKYNIIDGTIKWTNGSEILLKDLFNYPSDPEFDELGSLEITGGFIDEANQCTYKAIEIVNSRIRFKLDENNLIPKLLLSCNPAKNWAKTEFYDLDKKQTLPPYRKFVKALATDNEFISPQYIENLKKIKNKALKERLLHGNWDYDDDPSALFDYDMISDMFLADVTDKEDKWITGDVARKGSDKMPVFYWEGYQVKEIIILPYEIKKDTKKSSDWIRKYSEKKGVRISHVIVDEDGVGGGVVDNLQCTGFINNGRCIQTEEYEETKDESKKLNYSNLRTQCYFELQTAMEQGKIGIDEKAIDPDVREMISEELGQIKEKDIDKDGTKKLVEKDIIKQNIGRSPDFADTIMMRMYGKIKPKEVEVNIRWM